MIWALLGIKAQSVPSASARETRPSTPATPVVESPSPSRVATESAPKKAVLPRPETGEKFGTLRIPKLEQTFPIIEGTGTRELQKGVGHFAQSVMPGESDNCVLSGHRDTVFRRLGELKIGDRLVVRTAAGEFTYKISRIRIVHKDDKTVIVHTDRAVLTVTTCYPFHYVGSAPDRYILIADLAESR